MGFDLASYEPVEDRLREFWADHPDGRIETVLEAYSAENGYIVKASVWREDLGDIGLGKVETMRPSATGYAHEVESDNPKHVNFGSALENCETSAIGRALANLGYAAKGKRPSREEMSKSSLGAIPGPDPSDAVPLRAGTAASDRSGEAGSRVAEKAAADTPSPEHHSPASKPYPVDPMNCDHKTSAGRWVKWVTANVHDFSGVAEPGGGVTVTPTEVCPKCGTPKLVAMEGTMQDLGAP